MATKSERQTGKTRIIEQIFDSRWNLGTQSVTRDLVTLKDVSVAIKRYNRKVPKGFKPMSDKNPANFFKDFIRRTSAANRNWPKSLLARGYTARQETGAGNSFRFIRLPAGHVTAFVESDSNYLQFPGKECKFRIQSLSLDSKSRLLGRHDESWLMQIAARLRLVQSHLALCSQRVFIEVSELQQNLKQSGAEIDGLFLGKVSSQNSMLITVEAKGRGDDILQSQIAAQVNAVMKMKSIQKNLAAIAGDVNEFYILPIAMKVIEESVVYIAEFEAVKYVKNGKISAVSLIQESLCQIMPPVEGIS
jgi:hypothetical protein